MSMVFKVKKKLLTSLLDTKANKKGGGLGGDSQNFLGKFIRFFVTLGL